MNTKEKLIYIAHIAAAAALLCIALIFGNQNWTIVPAWLAGVIVGVGFARFIRPRTSWEGSRLNSSKGPSQLSSKSRI